MSGSMVRQAENKTDQGFSPGLELLSREAVGKVFPFSEPISCVFWGAKEGIASE